MLGLDQCPHHPYVTGESMETAFCETLTSYSASERDAVVRNARLFGLLLRQKMEVDEGKIQKSKKKLKSSLLEKLSMFHSKASKYTLEDTSASSLPGDSPTTTHLRQLISSRNGYIGLTSIGVEEGDWICILYGARVPFVLRAATAGADAEAGYENFPCYRIVGDA